MKLVLRIATFAVFALSAAVLAQTPAASTPAPARPVGSIASRADWPKAKPEDVTSPEAIVAAVYSVISGGKGQERDWDRMRSLFVPDARLIPSVTGKDGHNDAIFPRPLATLIFERINFQARVETALEIGVST